MMMMMMMMMMMIFSFQVFICYVIALMVTGMIMQIFKAAQPALLYLVPFTTIGVLALSFIRGEFQMMMDYDETEINKEESEKGQESENKETTKKNE
jgi:minor histocompatibility antigen H13